MLALGDLISMICNMTRQTMKTSKSSPAPLRIICYSLPIWALSLMLMFVMPLTGFVTFVLVILCLFILPFKARYGACPDCNQGKLFPFSGFGSACRQCRQELVLRGHEIHLLEAKKARNRPGSGRVNRETFKSKAML